MKKFEWMNPPEAVTPERIDEVLETELLIIGAGQAGTAAAREAAEQGSDVVILEQQREKNQVFPGIGEMGYMNSRWQREQGVPEVDIDTFMTDWELRANNRADYRLIRSCAEHCGETFDWLIEPLGEEERSSIHPMMTPLSPNTPPTQNGIHAWNGTPNLGPALMRRLLKENQRLVRERGARFLFATRALQLTKDGERVSGAIAQAQDGHLLQVRAAGGRGLQQESADVSRSADGDGGSGR